MTGGTGAEYTKNDAGEVAQLATQCFPAIGERWDGQRRPRTTTDASAKLRDMAFLLNVSRRV